MKNKKFLMLPLVLFLLLSLYTMDKGPVVQAASQESSGAWSMVKSENPSTTENVLLGITTSDPANAWAVGYYQDDTSNTIRDLIERWDGRSWSVVVHPSPSRTSAFLYHVTALDRNNVWAVGRYTDSTSNQLTLVEHWNGHIWEQVASPNPGASFNTLSSIVALSATNIWAVGFYVAASGSRQTLIEHWNGHTWQQVDSPNLKGRSNVLSSISAVAANDIWAVGDAPDSYGDYVTLTEHWNGIRWSNVKSPNPDVTFSHLYGVTAITSNDVWAVGFYGAFRSLTVHWNGKQWNTIPSPNPGTDSNVLNAVTAGSAHDIWAVGYLLNAETTIHNLTLIQHWDGNQWSVVASPSVESRSNYLSDITTISGTHALWSVGYYYENSSGHFQTLVERYHP